LEKNIIKTINGNKFHINCWVNEDMINEKKFTYENVILNYAEGPKKDDPLLFMHGLTDKWQYFLPIIPYLSMRWHIFALDFRGHGGSSHQNPPYNYENYIKDAVNFLEKCIMKPTVLFGCSLGGMVALMVAAKRPNLVRGVIFGDSSVTTNRTRQVMIDYHSYWTGWKLLAGYQGPFKELVQMVSDMPVNVPSQNKKTYGEGLDIISLMNKANYLRNLDPNVLSDMAAGNTDDEAYNRQVKGYDHRLLKNIECPVLLIQGNVEIGGIFTDEAVQYALDNIHEAYHVYIKEYDHNLGLYNWDTNKLLQATTVFLESLL
jgi:pimeloyl-ACP methyl ester carboxylesterase